MRRQTQPRPTKTTLAIQTSLVSIDDSSYTGTASGESAPGVHPVACSNVVEISSQSNFQSRVELANNDIVVDVESTSVVSEVGPDL